MLLIFIITGMLAIENSFDLVKIICFCIPAVNRAQNWQYLLARSQLSSPNAKPKDSWFITWGAWSVFQARNHWDSLFYGRFHRVEKHKQWHNCPAGCHPIEFTNTSPVIDPISDPILEPKVQSGNSKGMISTPILPKDISNGGEVATIGSGWWHIVDQLFCPWHTYFYYYFLLNRLFFSICLGSIFAQFFTVP